RRSTNPGLILNNPDAAARVSPTALSLSPSAMTFGTKSPTSHGFDYRMAGASPSPREQSEHPLPSRRPAASVNSPANSPVLNNFGASLPHNEDNAEVVQKPKS